MNDVSKFTSKYAFAAMTVLIALLSFAYIVVAMRAEKKNSPAGDASLVSAAAEKPKLVLTDGDYSMKVGQTHQFTAQFEDGGSAENVMWSSTDEKVASIDRTGTVKALSEGEIEVWALIDRETKAHLKLSVHSAPDNSTLEAIDALAADGSDRSMKKIELMARSLSQSNKSSSAGALAVLQTLIRFKKLGAAGSAVSSEHWNEFTKAAGDAGIVIDQKTLRQAALAAYCQGEKSSADMTVSFAGDCTFSGINGSNKSNHFPEVYRRSGSVTYPFDLTRCVFGADSVTMINFEGTLTRSRAHKDKTFFFRGDPSYVNILTGSSIEAVTLENNHAYDYLDKGFNDTVGYLKNAGIRYTSFRKPTVVEVDGFRVVMLSLAMFDTKNFDENMKLIKSYVNRYRDDDTVIVMNIHWGVELASVPEKYQIKAAHAMIDCGVDVIIGHHPHVMQGIELYKGHYIVYSLGNFSFGGNAAANDPRTLIFRISYTKSGSGIPDLKRVSVVPCYTTSSGNKANNYRPTPVYGKTGQNVVNRLLKLSSQINGGVTSLNWSMIP